MIHIYLTDISVRHWQIAGLEVDYAVLFTDDLTAVFF